VLEIENTKKLSKIAKPKYARKREVYIQRKFEIIYKEREDEKDLLYYWSKGF